MTPDQIRWAEALTLELQMGNEASTWVAGRVAELAKAGEESAVAHMLEIAECLDQLITGRSIWPI